MADPSAVLPLMLWTGGITIAGHVANRRPLRPRLMVGVAGSAIVLSAMAEVSPPLGVGLALIVALTATVVAGGDVITRLAPN